MASRVDGWRSQKITVSRWCGREDSNLHGVAPASPSSWCVCRSATSASEGRMRSVGQIGWFVCVNRQVQAICRGVSDGTTLDDRLAKPRVEYMAEGRCRTIGRAFGLALGLRMSARWNPRVDRRLSTARDGTCHDPDDPVAQRVVAEMFRWLGWGRAQIDPAAGRESNPGRVVAPLV
jgi:hypothetical protein